MAFSLSAELEEFVRRKVNSGYYDSPAQVVEEALHLLEERDHLRILRRERLVGELASGISQADNRQLVDGDEVFRGLTHQAEFESE